MKRSLLAIALLTLGGCASSVATLQSARPLEEGEVQVVLGMDLNIPTSRIFDLGVAVYDIHDKYRDDNYTPTEEDAKVIYRSAGELVASGPGFVPELALRYGLTDDLDLGARYTGSFWMLEGRYQFYRNPTWSVSAGLSYARWQQQGFVFDALEYLTIDDFEGYDLHMPIIIGRSWGDWGQLWFGPKFGYGTRRLDAKLEAFPGAQLQLDNDLTYLGGFVGGALGLGYVHAYMELTVANFFFETEVLDEPMDLGGWVVVPSGGVMIQF